MTGAYKVQDLERQLKQKTAQLAVLREIGRAINAAWELQATLDLITRRTADVMDMDSCSIHAARGRLGDVQDRVKLVDPADLYEAIVAVIS